MSVPSDLLLTALNVADTVVSSGDPTQAYPTIPVEDDPTPPDTGGFSLVSDMVDFAAPLPGVQAAGADTFGAALTYGSDVDFDFAAGEPAGALTGNFSYVDDQPQILQWIEKSMMTPQGRYSIYDTGYGSILDALRGHVGPDQTLYSEIARTTQDCMNSHPRVRQALVINIDRVLPQVDDTNPDRPRAYATGVYITVQLRLDTADRPAVYTLLA